MTDATAENQTVTTIEIPDGRLALAALFGAQDSVRRYLERRLAIKLNGRGHELRLIGSEHKRRFAEQVIHELLARIQGGSTLFMRDVEQLVTLLEGDRGADLNAPRDQKSRLEVGQGMVQAKSPNQKHYLDLMQTQDLVFATGPAGTGKTYLAMAAAVAALRQKEVERLILARPAVEAGERLGFLPGSLVEKVNPYLRPLHDALFDLMGLEQASRLMDSGVIEVAPLAFMRGRTLNRSFVILDEAQNTTKEQMKMFLTRLGYGSRAVVTGDVTRSIWIGQDSGLIHVLKILKKVEGIGFANLQSIDVVRHGLVRAIIDAYELENSSRRKR